MEVKQSLYTSLRVHCFKQHVNESVIKNLLLNLVELLLTQWTVVMYDGICFTLSSAMLWIKKCNMHCRQQMLRYQTSAFPSSGMPEYMRLHGQGLTNCKNHELFNLPLVTAFKVESFSCTNFVYLNMLVWFSLFFFL